jgi:hypothetical protein
MGTVFYLFLFTSIFLKNHGSLLLAEFHEGKREVDVRVALGGDREVGNSHVSYRRLHATGQVRKEVQEAEQTVLRFFKTTHLTVFLNEKNISENIFVITFLFILTGFLRDAFFVSKN